MPATGIPAELTRRPMAVVRPVDAETVYAHPRTQLARLERAGLLHRLANGYYAIVPARHAGTNWKPTIEAATAAIATADFGFGQVALMGVTAARIHHAIPRALAVGVVAVPRRREEVHLKDRNGKIRFMPRDVADLDAEMIETELGKCLVTTIEQTVLDLAHQNNGGDTLDITTAIRQLLPRCDRGVLERIAATGRRGRALKRLGDIM